MFWLVIVKWCSLKYCVACTLFVLILSLFSVGLSFCYTVYQSLRCTCTVTRLHRKLAEQNIWTDTQCPYLYNGRFQSFQSVCENTPLCIRYTVIDSDVHMCIGRKKKTRVWSKNTSENPTTFCILPICPNSPTNSYDVGIHLFSPLSNSVVDPHKGSGRITAQSIGKKTDLQRWKWLLLYLGWLDPIHYRTYLFSYFLLFMSYSICSDINVARSMLYIGQN